MFGNDFERLESRQLLSASATATVAASTAGNQPAVVMSLNSPAPTNTVATPAPINVFNIRGNYVEKSSSTIFVTRLNITSVNRKGNFVGTLTVPWLFSNVPVRGNVRSNGRFNLKFEADFNSTGGLKGYVKGKMSTTGNALAATMNYAWNGAPTGTGWKITFLKKA